MGLYYWQLAPVRAIAPLIIIIITIVIVIIIIIMKARVN
jgi:hypothetical protein